MIYGAECWAMKKRQLEKVMVMEMRMLCWTSGLILKYRVKNECMRDSFKNSSNRGQIERLVCGGLDI